MRGGPHERRYSTLCRHFDSISIVDYIQFLYISHVFRIFDVRQDRIFAILFVLIPDKDHRDVIIDHRPLCNDNYGTPAG